MLGQGTSLAAEASYASGFPTWAGGRSPGAEPVFPPGGAFPASPSQGLSKGLALSKLGHAWRVSLLCLGAGGLGTGGAEPASQLRALLGPSGQPRERKAPCRPGPPPTAVSDTPKAIAGTQQGKHSQALGFPMPLPPSCPQIAAEAGSEPREARRLLAHPLSALSHPPRDRRAPVPLPEPRSRLQQAAGSHPWLCCSHSTAGPAPRWEHQRCHVDMGAVTETATKGAQG